MMLLPFLVLGFAIENDAFAIRNSLVGFSNQRSTLSTTTQYRYHSNVGEALVLSARTEKNNDSDNSNAELFLLEYSIDSFLRGDYDRTFSDDAAAPLPGLSPSDTIDAALRSLRNLDEPEPSHGAAVFLRFCAELDKAEKWGTSGSALPMWTELLRGALTPTMLARRIRASEEYCSLLDWKRLVVEAVEEENKTAVFRNVNVACVEASLFFDESASSPDVYRFNLAKMLGGVWLIESVEKVKSSLAAPTQPRRSKNPQRPNRKRGENGGPSRRGRQQQRAKQRGGRRTPKFDDKNDDDDNGGKKTTK